MYLVSVGVVIGSYWANTATLRAIAFRAHATNGSSILHELLSFDLTKITSPVDNGATLLLIHNYIGQLNYSKVNNFFNSVYPEVLYYYLFVLSGPLVDSCVSSR